MNRLRAMQWSARALCAASVLVLVFGAALWLMQQPQFAFRHIEVRSDNGEPLRHVTEASIRSALKGPLKGQVRGNFFTMDLAHTRRLFETVPWVARASVRRVWPDGLVITVDEHQALGLWNDGRVLSTRGVLFVANAAEAELDGAEIAFSGPSAQAENAALRVRQFNALLAPMKLHVAALDVSERAAWSITTQSEQADGREKNKGPRIELGRDEPPGRVQERLRTLAAAWPQVMARYSSSERTPPRIDTRYANGFAVAALTPISEKTRTR